MHAAALQFPSHLPEGRKRISPILLLSSPAEGKSLYPLNHREEKTTSSLPLLIGGEGERQVRMVETQISYFLGGKGGKKKKRINAILLPHPVAEEGTGFNYLTLFLAREGKKERKSAARRGKKKGHLLGIAVRHKEGDLHCRRIVSLVLERGGGGGYAMLRCLSFPRRKGRARHVGEPGGKGNNTVFRKRGKKGKI